MSTIELNVETREAGKKGLARKLRASGLTPGVFYGPKAESKSLSFSAHDLRMNLRGHNWGATLVKFKSKDGGLDGKTVRLKNWDIHPLHRSMVHVDFMEVDLSQKMEVSVPLNFVGKAKGVEEGGVLQPIHREITIKVSPTSIPDVIDVDVSSVDMVHALKYQDITLPGGAELVSPAEDAVVTCTVIEEEVEAPAGPAEGEAGEGAVAAGAEGGDAAKAEGAAGGDKGGDKGK